MSAVCRSLPFLNYLSVSPIEKADALGIDFSEKVICPEETFPTPRVRVTEVRARASSVSSTWILGLSF
jgi:hypothetical protein